MSRLPLSCEQSAHPRSPTQRARRVSASPPLLCPTTPKHSSIAVYAAPTPRPDTQAQVKLMSNIQQLRRSSSTSTTAGPTDPTRRHDWDRSYNISADKRAPPGIRPGIRLGYAWFGQRYRPRTTIVFIHGLACTKLQAGELHRPALKTNVRILAIDRPGVGNSSDARGASIR